MPREITRLRNIGIMAHVDAGKTTCAERILFLAGLIRDTGEVHDGNTRLDFHPLERKKGITIQAAATSVPRSRGIVAVTARAPIENTFDFVPRLRAITHGRAEAVVRPDGYDVAPGDVASLRRVLATSA